MNGDQLIQMKNDQASPVAYLVFTLLLMIILAGCAATEPQPAVTERASDESF